MKKNRQSRAVEGLEPGTNYVYQVGDGTIWSETLEFTTTAVASKLSFFVLADLQAYSNNITDISEGGTVWLSGDGHCTFCGLLPFITDDVQRGGGLASAAAFTARSAGYFRSCTHVTFCGVTAAVAPNRSLAEVHFVRFIVNRCHFG